MIKTPNPPSNAKQPLSSDGDDINTSGVISPQHPPKDPSVNQSCAIIIRGGGSCGPRCIMKTECKVHNPNTTYKVSHVRTKSIR
jgi:hypothetical protein